MPSQLFADGFEAGSYAAGGWDGTTVTGAGQSAALSAAALRNGTAGSRSVLDSVTDQNYEAKAYKLIPETPNGRVYLDCWVRLTAVLAVGFGVNGSKSILTLRAADGQPQLWLSMRSGGVRASYMARNGSTVSLNSTIAMTTGTWYRYRLLVDRSATLPVVRVWRSTDGTTWTDLGSATDGTSGTNGVGGRTGIADVGIAHIANFEPGRYTVDYDDVDLRHSLGAGTDWFSSFVGGDRLDAAFDGVAVRRSTFDAAVRTDGHAQAQAERTGRLMAPYPTTGASEGVRMTPVLSYGVLPFLTTVEASAERHGAFSYAEEMASVFLTQRAMTGFAIRSIWLRGKALSVDREPLPTKRVKASDQAWGTTVVSDQPWGTVVVSDEEG
jgi:hypothetical protein